MMTYRELYSMVERQQGGVCLHMKGLGFIKVHKRDLLTQIKHRRGPLGDEVTDFRTYRRDGELLLK